MDMVTRLRRQAIFFQLSWLKFWFIVFFTPFSLSLRSFINTSHFHVCFPDYISVCVPNGSSIYDRPIVCSSISSHFFYSLEMSLALSISFWHSSFLPLSISHTQYSMTWNYVSLLSTDWGACNVTCPTSAFTFKPHAALLQQGELTDYGRGGYQVLLTGNRSQVIDEMNQLESQRWLDLQSRGLLLHMSLLNANTNFFTQASLQSITHNKAKESWGGEGWFIIFLPNCILESYENIFAPWFQFLQILFRPRFRWTMDRKIWILKSLDLNFLAWSIITSFGYTPYNFLTICNFK